MKRTVEFILGLIGGISGIICAFIAMIIGGTTAAFGSTSTGNSIITCSIIALLLSVLAIVGSVIISSKTRLAGIFLIIAAIGGFICIFMFYVLPGVLLIISGLMCLIKKDNVAPIE